MINKYDKDGRAHKLGTSAETDFVSKAKANGWTITSATRIQNINEHWDYLIAKGNLKYKVDVKAEKRINRSDVNTQSELVWIELKNVQGQAGWLYGKADLIGFGNSGKFYLINRENLIDRVTKLATPTMVETASQALYKYYRRKNRLDLLTIVKFSDILDLVEFEI